MAFKLAWAGAIALALATPPALAANDVYAVNGAAIGAVAPGGYLPGVAAYFPNGLGTPSNPFATGAANPSSIYSNQQAATLSATALPSQALVNGIVLTALATNTGTIYVGPAGVTSATGYPLAAGQSISYAVANLSAISIVGTNTTDKLAFTGN
jgi:hypothetical protein